MAVYNEIQVGRYNRLLQKLLSMKGSSPASSLGGEILTTLPLFHGVENRYLEGWDRFGIGNVLLGAAVGNPSVIRFRNPTGSNVIAVIEKVTALATPVSQMFLGVGAVTVDLVAPVATATFLDPRGRPNTILIGSSGNPAAATVPFKYFLQPPDNNSGEFIQTVHQEVPVLPGHGIEISTGNNITIRMGMAWRERFLEDSERT